MRQAESTPSQPSPDKRCRDFAFNLQELAGAMGDFGTLFPLAIGYIAVNGLDPAGLFIMLGLTNIALGLIYRLPMPLQPKKVIAVAAITQRWSPPLIYASGFGLGVTWFLLIFTGLLRKILQVTPMFIVRAIQLALGIMIAWEALKLMRPAPLLGLLAVFIVLVLRENRYAPAAVVLMALGVGIMAWQGELVPSLELAITLPPLTLPRWDDVWKAMLLAGFAQVPLSITNAVIATAALIQDYFPEKAVSERKLMLNMGFMNVIASFFGGMPMCHGAGGLDVLSARNLRRMIAELRGEGVTVFLTTHYLEEAERLCDRIAPIVAGHIVAVDTVEGLRAQVQGRDRRGVCAGRRG